jgi:membrane protein required for colicin V production
MNQLDWLIVIVIVLSAIVAAAQGLLFEMFSLAGTVFGYLIAAWGYGQVSPWFVPYVRSAAIAHMAGFLTIFLAVSLLGGAAGRIARWTIQEVGLRWADRLLGAAFGMIRGVIVAVVGVVALATFAPESKALTRSASAGYFLLAGRSAVYLAPSELRARFRQGLVRLREAQHRAEARP